MAGRRTKGARKTPDMAARQRAIQAVDLYTEGLSLEQIAKRLGYASRSGAFYAINKALERHESLSVEKMRAVHGAQLDEIIYDMRQRRKAGDELALWASDRELRAMADKARLWGLDITREEIHAAMPYQKKIVLEDGPLQIPSPVVDEGASDFIARR